MEKRKNTKDNKKLILAAVALAAIVAIFLGVYFATRPQSAQGAKTFTVTVIHKDGTGKDFTYHTDEEYLGAALVAEGLIQGENGMYTTVDGETADWDADNSYWAFYVGEAYASAGIDQTPVKDGDTFKLVYTVSRG